VHREFWWGNVRDGDPLEDPDVDGRVVLQWILEKWDCGRMDWIDLIQDRDRRRALVNTVMNIPVP
jgi:hypothetical protein